MISKRDLKSKVLAMIADNPIRTLFAAYLLGCLTVFIIGVVV